MTKWAVVFVLALAPWFAEFRYSDNDRPLYIPHISVDSVPRTGLEGLPEVLKHNTTLTSLQWVTSTRFVVLLNFLTS
jgi:hypothetical protein